eukprot:Cvel_22802.t1-p1 / transcript=Cvel_22802.t1 / gene=Cvel_22802 / organism=Chromera_velia_CCMP2878 / gene_product=ATP-binding cassette sub-family A member 5, putative / transcript_product=ATP-binding cassette sub-family A member 5, putative / location=Cvel_scaffold2282:1-6372(-) / protein_length=1565 / sequence_SO=supercontig / SO=protein_coding / is_pseudo=false
MTLAAFAIGLAVQSETFEAVMSPPELDPSSPSVLRISPPFTLAFVPNSTNSALLMDTAADLITPTLYGIRPSLAGFPTESALLKWYEKNQNGTAAAVIFRTDPSAASLEYTLRVPEKTQFSATGAPPENADGDSSDCYAESGPCPPLDYVRSGFLALQSALHRAFLQTFPPSSSAFPSSSSLSPTVSVMPLPEKTESTGRELASTVGPLFALMAFAPAIQYLMTAVVMEKEIEVKQVLCLAGMSRSAYWTSWILTYAFLLLPSTLAASCILGASNLSLSGISAFPVLFLLLYLYALSLVALGCLLSTAFSKARSAGTVGSLASNAVAVVAVGIGQPGVGGAVRWGLSWFSPVAASAGLDAAFGMEGGLGGALVRGERGFSAVDGVVMLLVDTVLYALLAWYVDCIIPGSGPVEHPSFVFSLIGCAGGCRRNVRGSTVRGSPPPAMGTDNSETPAVPSSPSASVVSLTGVQKRYRGSRDWAVKGISFDIREGEIFGLLGHNGAGKTTVHGMLTGLVTPTSGEILIDGHPVSSRTSFGVCPQSDILLPLLTVSEHVSLVSAIKGARTSADFEASRALLVELGLQEKENSIAQTLSGGEKRKLCVILAMIGNPKVLFLDEPSAAMDPLSRHQLWSALQRRRSGRAILLTTHSMEEADVLADRKAVMSRGLMVALGTSLSLKRRLGLGYTVAVTIDSAEQRSAGRENQSAGTGTSNGTGGQGGEGTGAMGAREALEELLCTQVPDGSLVASRGMRGEGQPARGQQTVSEGVTVSWRVPYVSARRLGPLLRQLDSRRDELRVQDVSVTMTSLEEVFLRLQTVEETQNENPNEGPSGGVAAAAAMLTTDAAQQEGAQTVPERVHGEGERIEAVEEGREEGWGAEDNERVSMSFWQRVWVLMGLRLLQTVREPLAVLFLALFPSILIIVAFTAIAQQPEKRTATPTLFSLDAHALSSSLSPTLPAAAETESSADLWTPSLTAVGKDVSLVVSGGGVDALPVGTALTGPSGYLAGFANSTGGGAGFACAFGLSDGATPEAWVFGNSSSVHSLAVCTTMLARAQFSTIGAEVSVSSQPLPVARDVYFDASAFNTFLIVAIALGLFPGGFAISLVRDREYRMRHLLRLAGVSAVTYWIAYFLTAALIAALPVTVMLITAAATEFEPFMGPAFAPVAIGAFLFIPASLWFSFLGSFLFKSFETCQLVWTALFGFFIWVPYMVVSILDLSQLPEASEVLHFVFCTLLPPYSFAGLLYFTWRLSFISALSLSSPDPTLADYFSPDNVILPTLIIMIFHSLLLPFLVFFLDTRGRHPRNPPLRSDSQGVRTSVEIDPDVQHAEREAMEAAGQGEDQRGLRVQGIQKVFRVPSGKGTTQKDDRFRDGWFVAVESLSFCVRKGSIFGLLGPNGAGKSVSISVMTGEEPATGGDVRIAGHSVSAEETRAVEALGFCPQASALWHAVTPREHLELYAVLGGRQPRAAAAAAGRLLKSLDFEDHGDKYSQKLSGGTRRKLSVAIALISRPRVCVLDEPSAGMDPASRRALWEVLQRELRGNRCAAVVTTHAMEEAETLCDCIGI